MATKSQGPVYDQENDEDPRFEHPNLGPGHDEAAGKPYDPRGHDTTAGDPSDPRGDPNSTPTPRELQDAENAGLYNAGGDSGTAGAGGSEDDEPDNEDDTIGSGYPENDKESGKKKGKIRSRITKRRALLGGIGTLFGITGIFGFLSIVSGPGQMVEYAQLLQKFHLSSNEDFGDDRGMKLMQEALGNTEQTRLGITTGRAANAWEKKLAATTGMKPVYSNITGRFVGYAVTDEEKAYGALGITEDDVGNSSKLESTLGKGTKLQTAADATAGKQGIHLAGGGKVEGKTMVIDLSSLSFSDRRASVKTVGKLTNTWKVVSSLASRLEIKRAGIDFHPLKNVKRKATDKLADYVSKVRDQTAKEEETGINPDTSTVEGGKDADGKDVPVNDGAAGDANAAITDAEKSLGRDGIKEIVGRTSKSGLLGVMCAVKSFGSDILKYKYLNNALPMIRMAGTIITGGNEIMSDQGTNLNEVGADSQAFYNPKDGTTFMDAKSIQANLGEKQTGASLPPEAELKNIGSKPKLFNVLDDVPLLGSVCTLQSSLISSIPIIGGLAGIASSAITSALDGIAGVFGTSTEDIETSALSAASGKSVDTLAEGGTLGAEADAGAFLLGGDNAISMGGAAMSAASVAQLQAQQKIADAQDAATESLSQRYLDRYNPNSLVGSLALKMPSSTLQFASIFSDLPSLFSDSLHSVASMFSESASADSTTTTYDYGLPTFGFSPSEENDPTFADPFDNAKVIEQPGVLDQLNSEYGQACFGMTVTSDDTGVHVQTDSMGSDQLNMFHISQNPTCNPATNKDPMFERYRFYLADAVSAESLDCYEGTDSSSDQSCTDLGINQNSATTDSTPTGAGTTSTAGASIDMTNLYKDSTSVACAQGTNDIGVYDGYTDGNKVEVRLCTIPDLPSTGSEAQDQYGVKGADGKCMVNSRVSGAVYAMVQAMAKDGVPDVGADSCFRTMEHQQCLYAHTCGDNAAAAPGTSNHQMGLAIDFGNNGLEISHGDPIWNWLVTNAIKFGYKNLPSEAWHWSPTGT